MSVNIKDNLMTPDLQRTYEISLWTLQDSFIAVLGDSSSQTKGYIEDPVMQLSNDGTQELDFSLPMYIDNGIKRVKSNIWAQMTNAVTIAGMRKIKVIFNKNTDVEKVYEFIITRVTDTHEQNRPMCEIHCEGLAFHELGKIGYKISLSMDNFYTEQSEAYDRAKEQQDQNSDQNSNSIEDDIIEQIEIGLEPTIDYWNEKIGLTKYPEEEDATILSSIWYYRVQMDWSSFEQGYLRAPDKVYEESYISEYNEELDPKTWVDYAEKTRFVEASESNIYNLTQDIAKTFGVYCKYEYQYDENYHIIGRIVTYYNNFIDEKQRLEFTYPYTSKCITRENDCTDLVTKMYVNTVESAQSSTGLITIMDNPVNPTGEDYLLNFDYLYAIGTITNEQYAYIKEFSKAVKRLNNEIIKQQNIVIKQQTVESVYAAELEVLDNSLVEEMDIIDDYDNLLQDLLNTSDGIERTGNLALELFIVDYVVTFPDVGVYANSIVLYDGNNNQIKPKYNDLQVWSTIQDKTSKYISGIRFNKTNAKEYKQYYSIDNTIKVEYKYYPHLYYDEIIQIYTKQLALDQAKRDKLYTKIQNLRELLDQATQETSNCIEEKAILLKEFERIMGPALREGNWTPEEYTHTANAKYQLLSQLITTNNTTQWPINNETYPEKIIKTSTLGPTAKLIWDTELEYNEVDCKYTVNSQERYYCILPLEDTYINAIVNYYKNNIDSGIPLGLFWWNASASSVEQYASPVMKFLAIGSGCECAFLMHEVSGKLQVIPALILTGVEWDDIRDLNSNCSSLYLGGIQAREYDSGKKYSLNPYNAVSINTSSILNEQQSRNYQVCQLRLRINDYTLLTDEQNLKVYYRIQKDENTQETIELVEYNDYSVGQIVHTHSLMEDNGYDITFKPFSIIKYWNSNNSLYINYACSQLSTAVYLDAVQVLKENAYPKVTYSVDPNLMYKEFFYTDYNSLNKIAFINDNELEFNQVQGYISGITLKLNKPWEDTIEVKNYKNKFEDIFSTIVAQTESMERTEATINNVGNTINTSGTLSEASLQAAISKMSLKYNLIEGTMIIDRKNGCLVSSDNNAISLKPVGLYFSSGINSANDYIWNEAISSKGINASAISYGKLSLNNFILKGTNTDFSTDNGLVSQAREQEGNSENIQLSINNGVLTSDTLSITNGILASDTLSITNGSLLSNTISINNGELISKNITISNNNGTTTQTINYTLSITNGNLTSGVLTIKNGLLTLVNNRNTSYNAVQLIPASNSDDAYLYIKDKNNFKIDNQNIQTYIEDIAENFMTGSWSSFNRVIPIENINIGRERNDRYIYLSTSSARYGVLNMQSPLYYIFEDHKAKLSLGGQSNPIIYSEISYNQNHSQVTSNKFTIASWNATNTDGLYTKDLSNNIVSQVSPSRLKIDDYIETVSNAAGKNVILSQLWLTRAELGSNQEHIITFKNDDLQNNIPDYKLKITSEGLFFSLDGGETYYQVAIVEPEIP